MKLWHGLLLWNFGAVTILWYARYIIGVLPDNPIPFTVMAGMIVVTFWGFNDKLENWKARGFRIKPSDKLREHK